MNKISISALNVLLNIFNLNNDAKKDAQERINKLDFEFLRNVLGLGEDYHFKPTRVTKISDHIKHNLQPTIYKQIKKSSFINQTTLIDILEKLGVSYHYFTKYLKKNKNLEIYRIVLPQSGKKNEKNFFSPNIILEIIKLHKKEPKNNQKKQPKKNNQKTTNNELQITKLRSVFKEYNMTPTLYLMEYEQIHYKNDDDMKMDQNDNNNNLNIDFRKSQNNNNNNNNNKDDDGDVEIDIYDKMIQTVVHAKLGLSLIDVFRIIEQGGTKIIGIIDIDKFIMNIEAVSQKNKKNTFLSKNGITYFYKSDIEHAIKGYPKISINPAKISWTDVECLAREAIKWYTMPKDSVGIKPGQKETFMASKAKIREFEKNENMTMEDFLKKIKIKTIIIFSKWIMATTVEYK